MINLSKTLAPVFIILGLYQTAYASTTPDLAVFKNSWLAQALKLQREIDLNAPLSQATFLGTHNSYNSEAYQIPLVRYIDPNHKLSIYDQLEAGARSIELDLHWTLNKHFSKDILLCHAKSNHIGCSVFDRKVMEGLQEIRRWIQENPNEIVLLYLERHLNGHEPRMAALLDQSLGEFMFKPEVVRDKNDDARSCVALPGKLTKAGILNAGKQVLVVTQGCDGSDPHYQESNKYTQVWNDFVFAGIGNGDELKFRFLEGKPKDFPGPPDCGKTKTFTLDPSHSSMWRIYEDRTVYGNLPVSQKKIDEYTVLEMGECGINWQAMDMLTVGDPRLGAAVWSWAEGYPKEDKGECAVYKTDSGFVNADCQATTAAFACKNEKTGEIHALSAVGMARDGSTACASKGNDWRFFVPVNAAQMSQLQESALDQSLHEVWLNYRMNKDRQWVANGG